MFLYVDYSMYRSLHPKHKQINGFIWNSLITQIDVSLFNLVFKSCFCYHFSLETWKIFFLSFRYKISICKVALKSSSLWKLYRQHHKLVSICKNLFHSWQWIRCNCHNHNQNLFCLYMTSQLVYDITTYITEFVLAWTTRRVSHAKQDLHIPP